MEKGEGRWADPSTQNITRLPESFLPEFLRRKTIYPLSSVAINNGFDGGQDPFDNNLRRRAFEKWDLRKFAQVVLNPEWFCLKKSKWRRHFELVWP